MIREILHRQQSLVEEEEEYQHYFPVPDRNTIQAKQQSMAINSIAFQNFASFDNQTNKLYLNLDVLQEYENDHLNFIATIGCDFHHQSQTIIEISENPVMIINGISYFVLSAKCCQLDILKILYMLSQSIYIHGSFVSQLQLNIDKAVDLEECWDIHNFLYFVGSGIDASSGLHTMADTKQLNQRGFSSLKASKIVGEEKPSFVSNHLLSYFSQINTVQYRNSVLDIELIRTNIKNQYDPFTTRVYNYHSIVQSCAASLFDNKPLLMSKFQKINSRILCQDLHKQAITNFEIFSMNVIDGSRVSKKQEYYSLKQQVLQPFEDWEVTWLSRTSQFSSKRQDIIEKIQNQLQRIKSISLLKSEKNQIAYLNSHLSENNLCKSLGNIDFDSQQIKFSIYHEFFRDKIYPLIEILTSPEWRGQNKLITTGNDLLANLETRIDINQKKKAGLEQGVKLAEKQKDYLSQLVFAYVSKISPFQIVAS